MSELREAIRASLEDNDAYLLPHSWVAALCDENERLETNLKGLRQAVRALAETDMDRATTRALILGLVDDNPSFT